MPDPLPCLILTGASGIVGRSFLQAARDRFRIYAIARRPQKKAAVPPHPNIHWLQVDIGNHGDLATRFQFRREVRPVLMPKPLAWLGVLGRDLLGRMLRQRPFERLWMMAYLDRSLVIDGSHTRQVLGWGPTPRNHILRRLLFVIEKMKTSPQEGILRNQRAMKRPLVRPSLVIHDAIVEEREAIVDAIVAYLQSPVRHDRFPDYAVMSWKELRWYIGVIYDLLTAAVRTGDRELLLTYIHDLARRRFAGGFPPAEVCDALLAINDITVEEVLFKSAVAGYRDEVRDSITLSVALAVDGVQDAFDTLRETTPSVAAELGTLEENGHDLETIIEKLNAFYRPTQTDHPDQEIATGTAGRSTE